MSTVVATAAVSKRENSNASLYAYTGSVLVARKPFKVFAWVDRGYYRVGDTIHADFNAHTLDNKPVRMARCGVLKRGCTAARKGGR